MAANFGYNDSYANNSNLVPGSAGGGAVEAVDLDPSSGASFFSSDYKKHDDLKQMLDSNKARPCLEHSYGTFIMFKPVKNKDKLEIFFFK